MTDPRPYGPLVDETGVVFTLDDAEGELDAVSLYQEVVRPNVGPELVRTAGGLWEARFERPATDRIEYQFVLRKGDDSHMTVDPANPVRAAGAFGDKSVIEFPGYEPPEWTSATRPRRGSTRKFSLRSRALRIELQVVVWSSAGSKYAETLPLLVVNDGLDYAAFSQLLLLLEVMTDRGVLPPMRAALVQPVERDRLFSASAAHARAVAHELVPVLDSIAPVPATRRARVGMGASLGALAMLHAHRRHPQLFGALFLQSGSYFRAREESRHAGFSRFPWIARFVGQVKTGAEWAYPIPVTMTCGLVEENLSNNRAMRDALRDQDYDVKLIENRDGHNWIGWRDTFAPHLVDLLRGMWA